MKKLIKSKILLGTPVALFSLEIYFGLLLGYFLSKFFAGKQTGCAGIIKSIAFNIGNYRLHLHHWLFGFGLLCSAVLLNYCPFFPQFSYGFLGGLVFQGVSCYPDWYKILTKQKRT